MTNTLTPIPPLRRLALWSCVCAQLALPAAGWTADPAAAPAKQAEEAKQADQARQAEQAEKADKIRDVVREEASTQKHSAAAQARIDGLDDETQKLLAEYRHVTAEAESLRGYNEQIAAQIPSQVEELELVEKQLQQIETTSREVLPLIRRMLDTLGEFVKLDLPFLPEERRKRVATLEDVMNRANVTISEKYRRVVEAYQIEMEYGRTLEAYEGKLGEGDDARAVQFLRVGRVALMYQTLDGKETGYWDADKKDWVVDNDYKHAFAKNLAVAKKMGAPDLLHVPVPAPKRAES